MLIETRSENHPTWRRTIRVPEGLSAAEMAGVIAGAMEMDEKQFIGLKASGFEIIPDDGGDVYHRVQRNEAGGLEFY